MKTSFSERLTEARRAATSARIALRHAKYDRDDHLTWFNSSVDYTALGKNADARKLAFAKMLTKDERCVEIEIAVREAEDDFDNAETALACVLDEAKAGRDNTWAVLAEWVSTRTVSGQMKTREQAGREIAKEQVGTSLKQSLAEYQERYGDTVSGDDNSVPF